MADIALRQLQLIELLSYHRYGVTLERMQEATRELDIEVSERTIQRDLKEITGLLPVHCMRTHDERKAWRIERRAANDAQYPHHETAE
jgi:predicted DNA-binding transcriptional regulator YafY